MSIRRDPRRLFTPAQRAQVAARQRHACGVCSDPLPEVFHLHHVIEWANGGPTDVDNGLAVCPPCHLHAPTAPPAEFTPREWQAEAFPLVMPKLRAGEFATVNAAPGAGKTKFSGWVAQALAATNDVVRVVVFVPTTHLRKQWKEDLAAFGFFLDLDTVTERRGNNGVVLTYHALSDPSKVEQILADADEQPMLFVLDEVHHLAVDRGGEAGAWAVQIGRIVGTVDAPTHPVLNLSGTLFRSKPTQQISTIKYTKVGDKI